MPRRPRLVLAGVSLHLVQRSNNCQAYFFANEDCRFYLEWLNEYAAKSGCGQRMDKAENHLPPRKTRQSGPTKGALNYCENSWRACEWRPYKAQNATSMPAWRTLEV